MGKINEKTHVMEGDLYRNDTHMRIITIEVTLHHMYFLLILPTGFFPLFSDRWLCAYFINAVLSWWSNVILGKTMRNLRQYMLFTDLLNFFNFVAWVTKIFLLNVFLFLVFYFCFVVSFPLWFFSRSLCITWPQNITSFGNVGWNFPEIENA